MIQDQNGPKMNCNPWHVSAMYAANESRHSGDNLKHESSRQIKISSIMRLLL